VTGLARQRRLHGGSSPSDGAAPARRMWRHRLLLPAACLEEASGRGPAEWPGTALLGGALLVFAAQWARVSRHRPRPARFAELLHPPSLAPAFGADELLLLLLSLLLLCAGAVLARSFRLALHPGFAGAALGDALRTCDSRSKRGGGRLVGSPAQVAPGPTPALLGGLAARPPSHRGEAVVFFIFPRMTIGGLRRARVLRRSPVGRPVDLSRAGTVRRRSCACPCGERRSAPKARDLGSTGRARSLSRWTGQGWQAQEGGIIPGDEPPPAAPIAAPGLLSADIERGRNVSLDGSGTHARRVALSVDFRGRALSRTAQQRLYRKAAGNLFYQPVTATNCATWWQSTGEMPGTLRALHDAGSACTLGSLPSRGAARSSMRASGRWRGRARRRARIPADAAAAIERWLAAALSVHARASRRGPGSDRRLPLRPPRRDCELSRARWCSCSGPWRSRPAT